MDGVMRGRSEDGAPTVELRVTVRLSTHRSDKARDAAWLEAQRTLRIPELRGLLLDAATAQGVLFREQP